MEIERPTEWMVNPSTFAFNQEKPEGPYPVLPLGRYVRNGKPFEVTQERVAEFVANLDAGIPNRPPVTNIEHKDELGAVGWVESLTDKGAEGLHATINWTERGLQYLRDESFRYLSPEVFWNGYEDTDGKLHDNVFFGLAMTNYPWFGERLALFSDGETMTENYFDHMGGQDGRDLISALETTAWLLYIEEEKDEPDADRVHLLTTAKEAIRAALLNTIAQFGDSAIKLLEQGMTALAAGTGGEWLNIKPKLAELFTEKKEEHMADNDTESLFKRLEAWITGQEKLSEKKESDNMTDKEEKVETVVPEPVKAEPKTEPVAEKETPVVDATAFADMQADMAKMSDRLNASDKINADQKAALDISNAEVDKFKEQFTDSEQKRRVAEYRDKAATKFASLPGTADENGVLLMWAFDNDTTEEKTMYGKFTDMLSGANAAYAEKTREVGHLNPLIDGDDPFMAKVNERAAQYREQNPDWKPEKAQAEAQSAISKEDPEGALRWDKRMYG